MTTGESVPGSTAFSDEDLALGVGRADDRLARERAHLSSGRSAASAMWPGITEPTPALMAARNGTSSTESSRARGRSMTGSPRCESTAVSPWPGKCFAVAITPAALRALDEGRDEARDLGRVFAEDCGR